MTIFISNLTKQKILIFWSVFDIPNFFIYTNKEVASEKLIFNDLKLESGRLRHSS